MKPNKISLFWIEDQLDEFVNGGWGVLKAELTKREFELEGEQPRAAKTVEEAEKMLQAFDTSESQKPDGILLDLMLPQDEEELKNGKVDLDAGYLIWFEIRHLKRWSSLASVPIVVITARGRPEYMDQMLADVATRWLSKPADPSEVATMLVEIVTSAGGWQEKQGKPESAADSTVKKTN